MYLGCVTICTVSSIKLVQKSYKVELLTSFKELCNEFHKTVMKDTRGWHISNIELDKCYASSPIVFHYVMSNYRGIITKNVSYLDLVIKIVYITLNKLYNVIYRRNTAHLWNTVCQSPGFSDD